MRSPLGVILYVVGMAILFLLISADPLWAHDCSSIQDCLQTSGYNGVVSVVGGVIAVGTGLLGTGLADPGLVDPGVVDTGGPGVVTDPGAGGEEPPPEEPKKEEPPKQEGPRNPCQSALDRFDKARGRKRFIEGELARMRTQAKQLDDMYEMVRIQGFSNAAIDIAFLGGGWGAVALGSTVTQGLAEKIAENVLLGIIKDGMKGGMKVYSGDKFTPEDAMTAITGNPNTPADLITNLNGMPKNARDKFLEELMAEHLTKGAWGKGGGFPGMPANWVNDDVAGPVAKSTFDSLSMVDTLMEANDKLQQMETIRTMYNNTKNAILQIEHTLQFDVESEIDFSKTDMEHCQEGEMYQRYLKALAFKDLKSDG